jgi:hypothetical protein
MGLGSVWLFVIVLVEECKVNVVRYVVGASIAMVAGCVRFGGGWRGDRRYCGGWVMRSV